ncbi:hypothetical protein KEH59_00235 (plasmid) [Burkholderia contaminans]|uniref:hypothetical protein n=1 Tax=Burkholderia contaminans TaxID=488447 RepID=UPI001BA56854|nr:hypothetical protein [Burkholderia contaminans]QUN45107.1 hypothetical protein KEH59_00235 [Burkholderia contaminans]
MMNAKSIYATPSNLDRVTSAFASAMSEFSNGMWIPFALVCAIGIGFWCVGHALESDGWVELYQIGGQAALDGYFATVHAAKLSMWGRMAEALSGRSVSIGGVWQGDRPFHPLRNRPGVFRSLPDGCCNRCIP